MMNLAQIVPDGMVVFFPSYSFLHSVKEAWGTSGLLDRFSGKKTVCVLFILRLNTKIAAI